ncbi:MAG: peroxiredoxin-like family protein [Vicinamibacterales bacterium]
MATSSPTTPSAIDAPVEKASAPGIMNLATTYAAEAQALSEQMVTRLPAQVLATLDADAKHLDAIDFQSRIVQPGQLAPAFALKNQRGEVVSLERLLAEGPVVLAFYRGEWCPYCNLQLRGYQRSIAEIRALGARLVAVSPQTPDHSLSMAEKNDLDFDVLSDPGNDVASSFGLVFTMPASTREIYLDLGNDLAEYNGESTWELPAPGTFVIARDGTTVFARADGDYRKRTEPAEILEVLARLR